MSIGMSVPISEKAITTPSIINTNNQARTAPVDISKAASACRIGLRKTQINADAIRVAITPIAMVISNSSIVIALGSVANRSSPIRGCVHEPQLRDSLASCPSSTAPLLSAVGTPQCI